MIFRLFFNVFTSSLTSFISVSNLSIGSSHSSGVGVLPFPYPVSQMAMLPVWSGLNILFSGVTPRPILKLLLSSTIISVCLLFFLLWMLFLYDISFSYTGKVNSLDSSESNLSPLLLSHLCLYPLDLY